MTVSLPDLSVVLITPHSFETIHRTVRHLCAQTLASRIELLLCVPSAGAPVVVYAEDHCFPDPG